MGDCQICCNKLTKRNINITCNYCDFSECRECFQHYLLDSNEPHCMNCKKIFNLEYLVSKCTGVFMGNEYKKHREDILFERERALLPETQMIINAQNEQRLNEAKAIKENFKNAKNGINLPIFIQNTEVIPIKNNNVVIRKCPMEDCRGFLDINWSCGICSSKICEHCNELVKDHPEHVCDPENVKSMKMINKDTKPCPKCGTMIHKISGCDQIWCVDCHTAFSWNKGTIETGLIHNPHYYEFVRKNNGVIPRVVEADLLDCNDLFPDWIVISPILVKVYGNGPIYKKWQNIYTTIIGDIVYYLQTPIPICNQKLRIDYLLGIIDTLEFKTVLQQREKEINKKTDFKNIYQMFYDVSKDIFRSIVIERSTENVHKQLIMFENLKDYFNESFIKIGKIYKCVNPGISENYILFSNYLKISA